MTGGNHAHGGDWMSKREKPGSIWTDILLPSNPLDKRNERRRTQQEVVLKNLRDHHRALYDCQEKATLSPDQAKELMLRLAGKGGDYDFKHRMHFLVRGLESGKEQLSWDVVIPAVPTVVPREPARFTPDSFAGIATAKDIKNVFLEKLCDPAPDTRDARIGQILISAILFGGMLQRRWMEPFLDALQYARTDGSLIWLEMLWVYHEKPTPERTENRKKFVKRVNYQEKVEWTVNRRWVADPLTALLIIRWLRDFPQDKSVALCKNIIDADSIINSYFSHARILLPKEYRQSLSALITDIVTVMGLKIPPFLVSYAAGNLKSVSLPDEVWTRVLTDQAVPRLVEISDDEVSSVTTHHHQSNHSNIHSELNRLALFEGSASRKHTS